MNDKKFCWTPQSLIATFLALISIVGMVGAIFFYFGKEKQAAETTGMETTRIVGSYSTLSEQVRKQGEAQSATDAKIDATNKRLDRIEGKLDRVIERRGP
jgi:hypothetical protein